MTAEIVSLIKAARPDERERLFSPCSPLTTTERLVVALIAMHDDITVASLATMAGVTRRTVYRSLAAIAQAMVRGDTGVTSSDTGVTSSDTGVTSSDTGVTSSDTDVTTSDGGVTAGVFPPTTPLSRTTGDSTPVSKATGVLSPGRKAKTQRKAPTYSAQVWAAYSTAYAQRYGVAPPEGAWGPKTQGLCSVLVRTLGADGAMRIASWYVRSVTGYYAQRLHPLELLVRDCSQLWVQMHNGSKHLNGHSTRAPIGAAASVRVALERIGGDNGR
jgi:hypothetical protein